MPSGTTTTGSLADSLPLIIDSARRVREWDGVFKRVVDWHTLPQNSGLNWDEIALEKLTAQSMGETDELNNPQQIVDTLISFEPSLIGIQVRFTYKARSRISANVASQIGPLKQAALERKKDKDFLTILDTATWSQPGAGSTLTAGHLDAAVTEILSNTTEPPPNTTDIFAVLHGRQVRDVSTELTQGVGTYNMPQGMTADIWKEGFMGVTKTGGAKVFVDGNLTPDGSDDVKGGVLHKMAVVGVQGFKQRSYTKVLENMAGAEDMFMYDEYIYGVRRAVWLREIYSDATEVTS